MGLECNGGDTISRELEKWDIVVGNGFLFQQVRQKQPKERAGNVAIRIATRA